MHPSLSGVKVRILFVGDDRRRLLDDLLRHVGVKVMGDHDWDVVAEGSTHPPNDFRIGVRIALGHHRSV